MDWKCPHFKKKKEINWCVVFYSVDCYSPLAGHAVISKQHHGVKPGTYTFSYLCVCRINSWKRELASEWNAYLVAVKYARFPHRDCHFALLLMDDPWIAVSKVDFWSSNGTFQISYLLDWSGSCSSARRPVQWWFSRNCSWSPSLEPIFACF